MGVSRGVHTIQDEFENARGLSITTVEVKHKINGRRVEKACADKDNNIE